MLVSHRAVRGRPREPAADPCRVGGDGADRRARDRHDLLADLGAARARRAPGQRDPAGRGVRGAARADPRPERVLARNRAVRSDRKTLLPQVPAGSLAAHVVGYSTVSRSPRRGSRSRSTACSPAPSARLANLVERQLDDLRTSRSSATPSSRRSTSGPAVALEQLGRRCGAVKRRSTRAAEAARDGLVAELRPEPRRERLRRDRRDHRGLPARGAARQPRLPGPLSAGLDLQGRDRVGGALLAPLRPSSTFVDPGYCIVYGKQVNNFDTSSPFGRIDLATALQYSVNSVFCNIGKALGAKRILEQARSSASTSGRRSRRRRERYQAASTAAASSGSRAQLGRRRRADGLRAGADARHAAPDGDGRGRDRQCGDRDAPVRRREARLAAGQDRLRTRPERLDRAVGPVDARDIQDMMVRAVRAARAPPRRSRLPHRRQDGHGRDGGRRPKHDLVHRLRRAARRAAPRWRSQSRSRAEP